MRNIKKRSFLNFPLGNKKAQITWFIIMGIVILVGVGTVIYIRQTTEKAALEPELAESKETRYEGEQEIRSFVDSCLKPIVLQGLEIQRLQAGYIEIPRGRDILTIKEKEESEQIKVIDNSRNVYIDAAGQGNEAPFWVTKYGLAIPSKEFMEAELEYYVTKELDKCVGDLKEFTDKGFIIEKEPITTDVSFAKSVWVMVKLPLTVTIRDITYEINDFNIEIPINMELIYNMASDLALYQESYAYLEGFTLDLIEKYQWVPGSSKGGSTYLPPKRKTDAGFGCDQTTWNLNEVKNDLKGTYNSNFKYLKVENTNFERITKQDPIEQGVYNSYIQNFFTEQYPTIHLDHVYDTDWFFNLDILPKSGNTIKPERTLSVGIPLVPRLCTFKYRFNYFYDFPVLLKIKDDKSAKINPISNTFEKEAGYEFHVPLWIFVCGNQKRECTGRAETFETNSTLEETAFCEDSQKLSGDITINIRDGTTPLKDVDIYYLGANSMQNCFIGRTNEEGRFKSKFPFCEGCSIELYKQNYPTKKQRFDVLDYNNKEITLQLDPSVNLTVNAKLIHIPTFVRSWHETEKFTNAEKMIELAGEYGYSASSLTPNLNELKNNKALMTVLLGETDLNADYNDQLIIAGENNDPFFYVYPDPENAKLSLAPGLHNINLVAKGDVKILNSTGDIITNKYILSPETSYEWKINELTNKNTVTFYSLVEHLSSELDLNPKGLGMILDPIVDEGTMKAELLYQGTPIFDSDGDLVNCINHRFIKADGRVKKDSTPGHCWKRINVDITKEEYLPYIMPELN